MTKSKMKNSKKETQMIEFVYSGSGTPVIVLGDLGSFIFSKATAHPTKGYKYLCFAHDFKETVSIKNGNNRRYVQRKSHDTYTVNMWLERRPETLNAKAVGLPHKALPARMKDFMKKTLQPFIDDEGYIHYSDIDIIKSKIEGKEITEILGKIQKKRKIRKKKSK